MEKMNISLKENGEHSLKKGIKAFKSYKNRKTDKKMLLKEALMFIHHGVELLLKEILVQKSEFLIFSDLKVATKKQLQADREGIDIFYLSNPPHTVTYSEAIDRVCAFVEILDTNFRDSLKELSSFRNQIEHYQIDVTADEVSKIIEEILPPLESLIKQKLSIQLSQDMKEEIKFVHDLSNKRKQFNSLTEKRFSKILPLLSGRKINKELINSNRDLTIPSFIQILKEPKHIKKFRNNKYIFTPDFLMETESQDWIVEIKGNRFAEHTLYNTINIVEELEDKPQFWLVTVGDIENQNFKDLLKAKGILYSNLEDLEKEIQNSKK
ncbi:MAG: hypothetical protein NXI25_25995 [bacterium]|nr:hypothetical protein [bacterium]